MKEQTIVGINTDFESLGYVNLDEFKISESMSILDYDSVVINTDFFSSQYASTKDYENKRLLTLSASKQIKEDFAVFREQLIDMLNQGKNVFVLVGHNENCFIYTGEKQFSGTGRNTMTTNIVSDFDMYSFLPVKINVTHIYGDQVEIVGKGHYAEFFKKIKGCFQYAAFFDLPNGAELLRVKKSTKVISSVISYGKGKIIFLPLPYSQRYYSDNSEWEQDSRVFLDALFELNLHLSSKEDEYILPSWTDKFSILNEKEETKKLIKYEDKLKQLLNQIEKQKQIIEDIQRYKTLVTASGEQLEKVVKSVLAEIGFTLIESEPGRSDVIAKFNDIDVVAEIKGVTKSAAEKHAAQLEKWVSQFIEENDRRPRPLLIVNGFCDTPLFDRDENVFPNQMLQYSLARNHILIDTTQLLCLFIEIKKDVSLQNERINELLATNGIYKKYENLKEFLNFED